MRRISVASDKPDELRKKGYSKDGKHNRVQVVLALMQTRDGLRVGYELFEGNTADVKTLEPAIASLTARFALDRVVFVADAGMLSADNVALLHSMGHDYSGCGPFALDEGGRIS
ncbi:MAG: transposase [Bacteroidota bacterium]|nr:transposase [Bacteroidota bacterium]